jgi:IS30 family transposase
MEKRYAIRRLLAEGMPLFKIAKELSCHVSFIAKTRKRYPGAPRQRRTTHLQMREREEIALGISRGESKSSIARRLDKHRSTISREVKAQTTLGFSYRAWRGEELAEKKCRRPKARKLDSSADLVEAIVAGLQERWSPEQIAKRLKKEHPDEPAMHVSHETIYKSLFIQGRGALRNELTKHLRSQRTQRKPRGKEEARGRITDRVLISQRPAEVEDRAVPGHWEGDLIVGQKNASCLGTLVERRTRFVMLFHLPLGKTAEHVREQMTKKVMELPEALRRTLTVDQGSEFAQHARFTCDTDMKVYFCDPHSPWQRGSNENTNGLLRQYFPKGEDLSVYNEAHLDAVARQMNGRPRQTLGWATPSEALHELLR